jgi:hypothetical protein
MVEDEDIGVIAEMGGIELELDLGLDDYNEQVAIHNSWKGADIRCPCRFCVIERRESI